MAAVAPPSPGAALRSRAPSPRRGAGRSRPGQDALPRSLIWWRSPRRASLPQPGTPLGHRAGAPFAALVASSSGLRACIVSAHAPRPPTPCRPGPAPDLAPLPLGQWWGRLRRIPGRDAGAASSSQRRASGRRDLAAPAGGGSFPHFAARCCGAFATALARRVRCWPYLRVWCKAWPGPAARRMRSPGHRAWVAA